MSHALCSSHGIVHTVLKLSWKKALQCSSWGVPVANTVPQRKQRRVLKVRTSFAVFEFRVLEKAEDSLLLHEQKSDAVFGNWSLSWTCHEESRSEAPRMSKNTQQPSYKKDFMVQILSFAQKGRWLPAAVPACASPSSFFVWGKWVHRRTRLQSQTAAGNPNCLRTASLHCLHRFLSCLLQVVDD